MTHFDFSDKEQLKKLFKDKVTVYINGLNLDLSMSTVTGLTDLVEDEIIAPSVPIEVIDTIF